MFTCDECGEIIQFCECKGVWLSVYKESPNMVAGYYPVKLASDILVKPSIHVMWHDGEKFIKDEPIIAFIDKSFRNESEALVYGYCNSIIRKEEDETQINY